MDCVALSERGILEALYHATGGPGWTNSGNWLTDAPLHQWHGVTTDLNGHVLDLYLGDNQLTGEIPAELGNLVNLRRLSLHGNQLAGEIPAELGRLDSLDWLGLYSNQLTGEIPAELGRLVSLQWLRLESNQLTGEIPAELGRLASLRELILSDNQLTGEIPAELGGLVSLEELYLFDNQLTGEIPAELGRLTSLRELILSDNQLTGALPPALASLSAMELFWYFRTGLCVPVDESFRAWLNTIADHRGTGVDCVPVSERGILEALYNAAGGPTWTNSDNWLSDAPLRDWHGVVTDSEGRVARLILQDNGLTGEIPAELGDLAGLQGLYLDRNQLTGEIPVELGSLASLQWLLLNNNALTGAIPPELGDLASLRGLFLDANQLAGGIPAELGGLAGLSVLGLSDNSELAGALPLALSSLSALQLFRYDGTGLCVPPDASFRAWLSSLRTHRGTGVDCASMSAQIGGRVSVDGTGLEGVTVTLSATGMDDRTLVTNAAGLYGPFAGLAAGDYTVSISGYDPGDYAFEVTSREVTIAVGEVADVPFDGVLLRSSGIHGRVSVEGTGLEGVTVTLSAAGMDDRTDVTEAGGVYAFTGLAAGDYTVGISGYNTVQYEFEVTSQNVTMAQDESRIVNFVGVVRGGSGNRSPVTAEAIPSRTLDPGGTATVDASGYFSDPDGDALTYSAASSNSNVARASVSGSMVTITAVARGSATVTITARDPGGFSAVQTFSVTVRRAGGAPLSEREVLEALYNATGGPGWTNNGNWLTDAPLEDWHGVLTNSEGRVARLILQDNQLTGAIPAELGDLAGLQGLYLDRNQLTGGIPAELADLASLQWLLLNDNELTGGIPAQLGNLPSLRGLFLGGNQLTGGIPAQFGGLTNLAMLLVNDNSALTGALPPALSSLSALQQFRYDGTGLCVPADASLRAWLNSLRTHRGTGVDCASTSEGRIDGRVSIEGTGIDGVTVNLSNGRSTTTSGGGSYHFVNVETGAYTVTISGYPSDVAFAATSAAATISSAGQSVTVNFSGAYIRTATVAGSVTVGNQGLGGVTVRLSGVSSATATTNSSGQVTFTGLRMGNYSVGISGYDSSVYSFATTSRDVTVGVGVVESVRFEGVVRGGGGNRSPVTSGTIPSRTLDPGGTATVNASSYFNDPDGDALTYSTASSNSSVARASVSGSTVTITAVAQGSATITITARDPGGLSAVQTFSVTVEAGSSGRDGECVAGATYGRGESCDVYGTGSTSKLTFTVLSDGRARLGFITAGNRISNTGTINGVKYHFVASHQGGGSWKVDEYIP